MKTHSASVIPWSVRLPAVMAKIFLDRAAERKPSASTSSETEAGCFAPPEEAVNDTMSGTSAGLPDRRADIMVPLDFSPESLAAADYAIKVARRAQARIILLHAIHLNLTPYGPANPAWLRAALCREALGKMETTMSRAQQVGVPVISVIEEGAPANVIVRAAKRWKTDLIVLAAEKRRRWTRFFGQHIREKLECGAGCPIVLIELGSPAGAAA